MAEITKSDLEILEEFRQNDVERVLRFLTPRLRPRGFTDEEIHGLADGAINMLIGEWHAEVAANPEILYDLSEDDQLKN